MQKILSHIMKRLKKLYIYCFKGSNYDGREFFNEAINNEKLLFMIKKCIWNKSKKIENIGILNLKEKLGSILSLFYKNHKKKRIKIIGVTGTNGKTSVTHFLAESLNALGKKVGLIGTIGSEFSQIKTCKALQHKTPLLYKKLEILIKKL